MQHTLFHHAEMILKLCELSIYYIYNVIKSINIYFYRNVGFYNVVLIFLKLKYIT